MQKSSYSTEFKEQALRKVYQREGRTIESVATELNMAATTLKGWMQAAKRAQKSMADNPAKRPEDWSMAARLLALQESHSLRENELLAWCREQGVFAHHLTQWRADFCALVAPSGRANAPEIRELKLTVQELERELRRKDKALAEAAALLILQKKFQALWAGEDK
jgi:transposase-like protein